MGMEKLDVRRSKGETSKTGCVNTVAKQKRQQRVFWLGMRHDEVVE